MGDAGVRQLLERLAEPSSGMLGSGAFKRALREGGSQAFGSTPCGHDLGYELLQVTPR